MENLKQQEQIFNLGKLLVKELGIEDGVDTLSRWMAHYVAEKIRLIEQLPSGENKEEIKKDCFETILKLWEHRWLVSPGYRPLENFESILKVLEEINPENRLPFFYRKPKQSLEIEMGNFKDVSEYVEMIVQIDRAAKIWIDFILHQAALMAKDDNTNNLLEIFEDGVNVGDIDAIRIILEDKVEDYHAKEIEERINELEKFAKLNEYLLEKYKIKLSEICK